MVFRHILYFGFHGIYCRHKYWHVMYDIPSFCPSATRKRFFCLHEKKLIWSRVFMWNVVTIDAPFLKVKQFVSERFSCRSEGSVNW